jgi:ribonuclease HII
LNDRETAHTECLVGSKNSSGKHSEQSPSHFFEKRARARGFQVIAGVDEAGRGPLAGPVVAAACILEENLSIEGVNDSKKLTPLERYRLYEEIIAHPEIRFGIGVVEAFRIDQINILQATFEAMLLAVAKLPKRPDYLLIDGSQLPYSSIPREAIVRGDALSQSIATASILAKESRDRLMSELHEKWPHYGFKQHKGYATREHLKALHLYGPSPIHRRTFNVKSVPIP